MTSASSWSVPRDFFASLRARAHDSSARSTHGAIIDSNSSRATTRSYTRPEPRSIRTGAWSALDSACLTPRANIDSARRVDGSTAPESRSRFTPNRSEISRAKSAMSMWSTSSPPRRVSPEVATTWKKSVGFSESLGMRRRIEMSNVPPPRSNTPMVLGSVGFVVPSPYARAAAVGSLTIRTISSPAIRPASRVAWRCASSKYAGTVTTAFVIGVPSSRSPRSLSSRRIAALTSCAVRVVPLGSWTRAVSCAPSTTS